MRRLSAVAAMCRAAGGKSSYYRIVQASLYSTSGISDARSRWFSCNKLEDQSSSTAARAVAGTMLFSVAATALTDEVHAKEPINQKFRPNDVVLYQYEACPFCNKVKDIIDKLSQKVRPKITAKSTFDVEEENKWRKWVDNHLVHVLSPNIYRNASEALESFDYITSKGNFTFYERTVAKYAGATAMYFVSKKLKKKYNITDERAALYEAAETWVDALNGRDFLGGSKPNLADLAVFGVLRPIRYLKSGQDMVENTRIGDWYSRMERAVGEPPIILA
nr:prostaglandin E synthase 2 [Ipomoea batatas]